MLVSTVASGMLAAFSKYISMPMTAMGLLAVGVKSRKPANWLSGDETHVVPSVVVADNVAAPVAAT